MAGSGDSFFAAAGGPTGLTAGLQELEALRQSLLRPKNNVIVPQIGAAPYLHVDPRAQQFNPMQQAPVPAEGIGLLPQNAPIMLQRKGLGNAPRLADSNDDRKALLRDIDNTIYGGGNAPVPTPTPTPSRSYFT